MEFLQFKIRGVLLAEGVAVYMVLLLTTPPSCTTCMLRQNAAKYWDWCDLHLTRSQFVADLFFVRSDDDFVLKPQQAIFGHFSQKIVVLQLTHLKATEFAMIRLVPNLRTIIITQ
jgi:hypothetical protein